MIFLSSSADTRHIKKEDENSETEEEYALEYVKECVEKRRQFDKEGYNKLDAYQIHHMKKKEL